MAIFPRIQSPCPYRGDLASVMDGDFCRACKRQVYDLTAMTDSERVAFFGGCATEVCVSYKLPLAALAMAAALGAPMAAAAQEALPADTEELWITVGGLKEMDNVTYVEVAADTSLPDLPVVYEEADAKSDAPQTAPVSSSAGT